MATGTQTPTPAVQPPVAPVAPGVIRRAPSQETQPRTSWRHLIPAWIVSGIVHVMLLGLIMLGPMAGAALPVADSEGRVIETRVDEKNEDANLENDDVGNDPDVPTNFNLTRIEEVSVSGPVNPNEAVGVMDAPVGTAVTLPPPPGFGGDLGQGGGLEGAIGKGNPFGAPGGMGGPKFLPGGFGGRSGATREQLVRSGGGNTQTEAAVAAGLKWLSLHQGSDGRWSLEGFPKHGKCNCTNSSPTANDAAGTAFGLLPFLGAGETHKGTGKNRGYAKNVERGLRFLITQQNREGAFSTDMYAQGIATITICEAYGLTADPQLKLPAQRALDYVARAQNARGGWDYGAGGPTPDTSIGAWQIMGIKSGQMGGLSVPKKTITDATRWLDEWAGDQYGSIYGYRQARGRNPDEGGASPQTMVAAGLLCRQYLGWGPRALGLQKGAEWLTRPENMPVEPNRSHMYYWYYATQVLHHLGGPRWDKWNRAMRDRLLKMQDKGQDAKHPHQRGSWDPRPDWWCAPGGRIMMTSMCLLTLEVYYRHLPLYRPDFGIDK